MRRDSFVQNHNILIGKKGYIVGIIIRQTHQFITYTHRNHYNRRLNASRLTSIEVHKIVGIEDNRTDLAYIAIQLVESHVSQKKRSLKHCTQYATLM